MVPLYWRGWSFPCQPLMNKAKTPELSAGERPKNLPQSDKPPLPLDGFVSNEHGALEVVAYGALVSAMATASQHLVLETYACVYTYNIYVYIYICLFIYGYIV